MAACWRCWASRIWAWSCWACVTSACSSAKVSAPVPVSALATTRFRKTGRLSAFRPVRPKAARPVRLMVGSGEGAALCAASSCNWLAVCASASILATVLTSAVLRLAMASLSKARAGADRPAAVLAPMAV